VPAKIFLSLPVKPYPELNTKRCRVDDPRLPRLLYFVLLISSLLMMVYYYPQMPRRMASHFAADGRINGWQSREGFFALMLLVTSSSAIICFFVPRQIAAQPNHRINLPNRDFWLAPERREQTMRFIAAMMGWFGCGVLIVLISGTYLALQANLAPYGRFNSEAMLVVLAAFLVSLFIWLIRFIRHFQSLAPNA
jgi:uncharacterized membrane protein